MSMYTILKFIELIITILQNKISKNILKTKILSYLKKIYRTKIKKKKNYTNNIKIIFFLKKKRR